MTEKVWKTRLVRALAVVAALILAVPLGDALAGTAAQDGRPANVQASSAGIDAKQVIGDAADAQGVLNRAEQLSAAGDAQVPASFEREIGLPSSCRDVRVDESGSVVGCTVDSDAGEALAAVCADLANRGWHEVTLGSLAGATFVKDAGACSWVLVTCTQVGSATSVVYRCVFR